ncbi:hypothetical protein NDU88_001837 [Pleurodeles waltl]|uniref:Retrotransposon gag domain-containing protein n=1 Tax=Pleurodeles waltl TaxID=8319 RepID=A0AAV7R894_PLEWA|nr:hypothetical protein NDU88_001837 [Pleurodeles waltl]
MATLDTVMQALMQLQKELQESKKTTVALVTKVTQLQTKVDGTGSTPQGATSHPPLPSLPSNISVNIPTQIPLAAPEGFSGDPSKVQIFLTQVELHFTCCPPTFPDSQSRIAFLISYLTGNAATWAVPLVRQDSRLLHNWCLFVEEFEKVFDRRAVTMSADKELLELRQGNKDLISYLSHFNRLVVESSWREEKRSALFYQGLKEELKEILAQIDPHHKTCTDLINLKLRLDHRLTERKEDKKHPEHGNWHPDRYRNPLPSVSSETAGEPME